MKKIHLTLGFIAALLLFHVNVNIANAEDINFKKAQTVAINYMSVQTGMSLSTDDVTLEYQIPNVEKNIPALYFFNTSNGGFCVVSGSDCMDPIIAYSTEGIFDAENIPPAMLWYMNEFAHTIIVAQNNDDPAPEDTKLLWHEMLEGKVADANSSKVVYRTMTSTWNQSSPYNNMCPMYNGARCYTGCVATAMSQIVHYWKYPKVGKGYVRNEWNGTYLEANLAQTYYNYDVMPDTYNSSSPWNAQQISETAKLNYHVGLVNMMDYGTDGSGAYTKRYTKKAFTNYYKYDKYKIAELDRTAAPFNVNFTSETQVNRYTPTHYDTVWADTLAKEIKAKRPVLYTGHNISGQGEHAGHAFVLERYNSGATQTPFWFNWGWGGSGDCWCNVIKSRLYPSGYPADYHYYSQHFVIIGITPPADSIQVGIEDNQPLVDLQPAYPNPASRWVTIPYTIKGDANNAELQIFSIDGRFIERRTLNPDGQRVAINVEAYPHGVYFYRINGVAHKFVVE